MIFTGKLKSYIYIIKNNNIKIVVTIILNLFSIINLYCMDTEKKDKKNSKFLIEKADAYYKAQDDKKAFE